jgi:hypothetical protein
LTCGSGDPDGAAFARVISVPPRAPGASAASWPEGAAPVLVPPLEVELEPPPEPPQPAASAAAPTRAIVKDMTERCT